jgi:serpin B
MRAKVNTAIAAKIMTRRYWLAVSAAAVSMLTMSPSNGLCGTDDRSADSSSADGVVGSLNEFALDLYREISHAEQGENVFFSPYSIYSALMMAAEGARGAAALEMGNVLRFPDMAKNESVSSDAMVWNTAFVHQGIKALENTITSESGTDSEERAEVEDAISVLEEYIDSLGAEIRRLEVRARSAGPEERSQLDNQQWELESRKSNKITTLNRLRRQVDRYELSVANALWVEETFPFSEDYLGVLQRWYDAGAHSVDFRGDPDGARRQINQWVEEATHHRIRYLVGSLDTQTTLVLANAIYFNGNWRDPFDEPLTEKAPFTSSDGSITEVDLMSKPEMNSWYADITPGGERNEPVWNENTGEYETQPNDDGFQLLELPYRGDRLAMLIILPHRNDGLADVERDLSLAQLSMWLVMLRQQEVHVYIPRVKMTAEYSLKEPMMRLGMRSPFRPGGLTGMSDSPMAGDLSISFIVHKAFLELNEKGTEAAAATALGTLGGDFLRPKPVPTFRADRPFMFLIRDMRSEAILFCGRMTAP